MKLRLFAAVVFLSSALSAAPITGLFNTGESTTGSADNYWTVVAPPGPAQVITLALIPNTWLANTVDSSWVWVNPTGQPIGSPQSTISYTFRISFNLDPSQIPGTVNITGRWATDNTGTQIRVNGNNTNQSSPDFDFWSSFTLNNFFVAGLNTIDFVVEDYGEIAGFRAEFLTADASLTAPEPDLRIALLIGLAVAFTLRKRSLKRATS